MGSVRRDTVKENIIFKAIRHGFKRLVRPKAVRNKNPWFLVSGSPTILFGDQIITRLTHSKLILESVYLD
jgi:hypothetical protein